MVACTPQIGGGGGGGGGDGTQIFDAEMYILSISVDCRSSSFSSL